MYGLGIPVGTRDKKGQRKKKMHKKRVKRTEQKRKGGNDRGLIAVSLGSWERSRPLPFTK